MLPYGLEIHFTGALSCTCIHACQQIEPLVAAKLVNVRREGEIRIPLTRFANVVGRATLAEVAGLGRLAVDGYERRQITEAILFVNDNRAHARVDQ